MNTVKDVSKRRKCNYCMDCGIILKGAYALRCKHCNGVNNNSMKGKVAWNRGIKGYFAGELHARWVPYVDVKCSYCNKEFKRKQGKKFIRDNMFCSKQCEINWRKINSLGNKNPNYIDGRTELSSMIRNIDEYKRWRVKILQRDYYTCQECGYKGKKLHVHHKKSFKKLFNCFINKYFQFSIFEDKETLIRLSVTYEPFWELSNGVTMCEHCHKSLSKELK